MPAVPGLGELKERIYVELLGGRAGTPGELAEQLAAGEEETRAAMRTLQEHGLVGLDGDRACPAPPARIGHCVAAGEEARAVHPVRTALHRAVYPVRKARTAVDDVAASSGRAGRSSVVTPRAWFIAASSCSRW